jgi:DNA-binding LacI/PurR family transcriptional regulator
VTADVLDAVQAEARRRDYRTLVVVGSDDTTAERAEVVKLLEFRVEGIIALGHRLPHGVAEAVTAQCPTVVVGSAPRGVPHLSSVSNDDVLGAGLAVDHLVTLGHQHIVHVDGGSSEVSRDRRRGYRAAMRRHGLGDLARVVPGSFTEQGGYRGARAALRSDDVPTALFVVNDLAAMGALAAVADDGLRVPEDVSVIGYDGSALGAIRPISLTSVGQPLHELGTLAAAQLCDRLDGEVVGESHTLLRPTLIERRTTAAPGVVSGAPHAPVTTGRPT